MGYAVAPGKVADALLIIISEFFPGAVSGGGNGGTTRRAADDPRVGMIVCRAAALLFWYLRRKCCGSNISVRRYVHFCFLMEDRTSSKSRPKDTIYCPGTLGGYWPPPFGIPLDTFSVSYGVYECTETRKRAHFF